MVPGSKNEKRGNQYLCKLAVFWCIIRKRWRLFYTFFVLVKDRLLLEKSVKIWWGYATLWFMRTITEFWADLILTYTHIILLQLLFKKPTFFLLFLLRWIVGFAHVKQKRFGFCYFSIPLVWRYKTSFTSLVKITLICIVNVLSDSICFLQLAEERRVDLEKRKAEEEELKNQKRPKIQDDKLKVFRSGVGKFLDLAAASVS